MDSGTRRLVVVDVTDGNNGWNHCVFAFVVTVVLTVTLFILACTHPLREFMEQFPYLSKRELRSIAAAHGIKYRSHLIMMVANMRIIHIV